ncbi:23S rRNA (uracil(1939)-C(5))-methyltransferase RlmD [Pelosinus sp. sgz500959]|uniref:23S rRNA (uracil(1939)-C(5))-methyltransferase RlmD n=1 Tax=Pelosinus sp. sgz500959 TaxID=3242472 RepID=UPI00366B148C
MKKQVQPVIKNHTYTLEIASLGHSGEGVGRYEGFTVFVPHALPGETVDVQIIEVKKNYAKANLKAIKVASSARCNPACSIYDQCGGCQLQHVDYQEQLILKRQTVVDAVTRIGKINDVIIHQTIGAQEPWYYRNKMQFPVGTEKGDVVVGCFAQGTHQIINTEHCLIQHQDNNLIAQTVQQVVSELGISTYDEHTGQGIMRHVVGRVGTKTGEVMVVLVTSTIELPQKDKIIGELRKRIPNVVSIVQNINSNKTNVIFGNTTKTLWGQDTITDQLGEFTFHISARSFFQVNTTQAELLYNKAVEYAGLSGEETVIDAYCGTGTITLFLARHAKKVYGIEIVEPAIQDAWRNAELNQVTNVEFTVGDATHVMPKMFKQGICPEVIVVDPPRAGCEPKVLETFAAMKPERIVYVSCNPASLARDLAVLADLGYVAKEIQPVDMFSHTFHVECVALIERGKA